MYFYGNNTFTEFILYNLVKEERFGFITLKADVVKSNQSKTTQNLTIKHELSGRPARLLPPKLLLYNIEVVNINKKY